MSIENNQQEIETPKRQPILYHDFNIRFAGYNEANSTFKVWVEGETPGGTMRPDNAVQRTYDPKAFWDNPAAGVGGLLDGLDRRNLAPEDLFKLGMLLADLALPEGEVRQLFDKSLSIVNQAGQGLRIRLRIDPVALVHLPWEFMALPQASGEPKDTDFLALRREVSIVRTDTVEAESPPLPDRAVARVVVVLSSPKDQEDLKVDDDQQAIEQAVQALSQAAGKDLVEVIWAERPATLASLEQALGNEADIFHFGGHAIFDPISKEGNIILEKADNTSEYYSSAKLAQRLRGKIRLAVLGACETGRRDGQNVWSGVAPALTREKIPAVIANQFKIKDDHAILIASKVYHRVLSGYTVDEALYEARTAIYQHKSLKNRDWGTPVLYLHDKSGVLFPRSEPSTAGGAADSLFVNVANTFGEVEGTVLDVVIGKVTHGRIQIRNKVDKVKKGAKHTSLKIDQLG